MSATVQTKVRPRMAKKQLGILVGIGCRRRGLRGKGYRPMRAGSVRLLIPEEEVEAFIAQQEASHPAYEFKVTLRAIIATAGSKKS